MISIKFNLVHVFVTFKFDQMSMISAVPQIRVRIGKLFLYFSSKTYVVGTQKNRLNETVLLSTQNTCLNYWVRK